MLWGLDRREKYSTSDEPYFSGALFPAVGGGGSSAGRGVSQPGEGHPGGALGYPAVGSESISLSYAAQLAHLR